MIRRRLHGFADIQINAQPGDPTAVWLADLPESGTGETPTITWNQRRRAPITLTETDGSWTLDGPGEMLRALLQYVVTMAGGAPLHAAGLEVEGRGVLVAAAKHVGKTALALAATGAAEVNILSDDRVVLTAAGALHSFPTPVALRAHHLAALPPHTRRRLAPAASAQRVLAWLRPIARAVGPPLRRAIGSGLGSQPRWVQGLNTEFISASTADVFPSERRRSHSQLAECVVLAKGADLSVTPVGLDAAVEAVETATYGDNGPEDRLRILAGSDPVDVDAHVRQFRAIVEQALAEARLHRVTVPDRTPISSLQQVVIEAIRTD